MAKKKKKESFVRKHIFQWCCAALAGVVGTTVHNIYLTILAPYQAQAAAGQLEDSVSSWVLHQQMSYGDVIPNVIIGMTVIPFVLFLLPTIIHAIKLAKTD